MPGIPARAYILIVASLALVSALALAQVVGAILTVTVTSSNGAGIYNAPNLPPGEHEVPVEASGLSLSQRPRLTLTVGERQVLNLEMQVGTRQQQWTLLPARPPSNSEALRKDLLRGPSHFSRST